jgi:hypothetical protein
MSTAATRRVQRCITVFVTHDTLTAVTASNTQRCTDAVRLEQVMEWIHGRARGFHAGAAGHEQGGFGYAANRLNDDGGSVVFTNGVEGGLADRMQFPWGARRCEPISGPVVGVD